MNIEKLKNMAGSFLLVPFLSLVYYPMSVIAESITGNERWLEKEYSGHSDKNSNEAETSDEDEEIEEIAEVTETTETPEADTEDSAEFETAENLEKQKPQEVIEETENKGKNIEKGCFAVLLGILVMLLATIINFYCFHQTELSPCLTMIKITASGILKVLVIGVGIGLAAWGVYDVVMSFYSNQPEPKGPAIAKCAAGSCGFFITKLVDFDSSFSIEAYQLFFICLLAVCIVLTIIHYNNYDEFSDIKADRIILTVAVIGAVDSLVSIFSHKGSILLTAFVKADAFIWNAADFVTSPIQQWFIDEENRMVFLKWYGAALIVMLLIRAVVNGIKTSKLKQYTMAEYNKKIVKEKYFLECCFQDVKGIVISNGKLLAHGIASVAQVVLLVELMLWK